MTSNSSGRSRAASPAKPKPDTLHSLAKEIKAYWPDLHVTVEKHHASTDTKISGTRLRRPGRGRNGLRIIVRAPQRDPKAYFGHGPVLLDHSNAETYRRTSEVRAWFTRYTKLREAGGVSARCCVQTSWCWTHKR